MVPMMTSVLLLILLFHLHQGCSQFYRECVTERALKTKICCPLWNGSPCGEHAGRGKCPVDPDSADVTAPQNSFDPECEDDRMNWPRGYFKHCCECYGNFSGYSCGECKYGLYGDKCDRKEILSRREIRELNPKEREKFLRYLTLAKTTTSRDFVVLVTDNRYDRDTYRFADASVYDVFAWIHHYAAKHILVNCSDSKKNFAHQGPAFPVWHRHLILFMERQLQRLTGDESLSIPYYNWTGEIGCSLCTDEYLGSNDDEGNISNSSLFGSWGVFCSNSSKVNQYCRFGNTGIYTENLLRSPGLEHTTTLPTREDVQNALKWKDYDTPPYDASAEHSFRNAMEGNVNPKDGEAPGNHLHNQVHTYMGKTMVRSSVSASDPMFLLHHCYVDCLVEEWITSNGGNPEMYPENDLPGHHPLDFMVPFCPHLRNRELLQSSTEFGYRYE